MSQQNPTSIYHPTDTYSGMTSGGLSRSALERIYCIAVACYAARRYLWFVAWGRKFFESHLVVYNLFQLIPIALLAFKFFYEGHTTKERVSGAVVMALFLPSTLVTLSGFHMWDALLILTAKNVRLERVAKTLLAVLISFFVLTVSLNFLGLSEGITGYRKGTYRPSLGFTNPNYLGLTTYLIVLICAYLWWRRRPLSHLVLTALLLIPTWFVSRCRTAGLCILLIAAVHLVTCRLPKACDLKTGQRRAMALFGLAFTIGSMIVTIMLMVHYDPANKVLAALDDLLAYRLSLAKGYFDLYPPSLFGINTDNLQPVALPNGFTYVFVVDSGYPHTILHYGIITSALVCMPLIALYAKAVKEAHVNACLVLLTVGLLYALVEAHALHVYANVMILAIRTLYLREPLSVLDLEVERELPTKQRQSKHLRDDRAR